MGDFVSSRITSYNVCYTKLLRGYRTETQMEAWQGYLEEDPAAVEFVMQGPLRPLVDQAILLSAQDDLGYLRVAMDCVIQLVKASKQNTRITSYNVCYTKLLRGYR